MSDNQIPEGAPVAEAAPSVPSFVPDQVQIATGFTAAAPFITEPAVELEHPAAPKEPLCYIDHARANRDGAIAALQALLDDMPPVSSVARHYAETRSDPIFAIHNLKQGRK